MKYAEMKVYFNGFYEGKWSSSRICLIYSSWKRSDCDEEHHWNSNNQKTPFNDDDDDDTHHLNRPIRQRTILMRTCWTTSFATTFKLSIAINIVAVVHYTVWLKTYLCVLFCGFATSKNITPHVQQITTERITIHENKWLKTFFASIETKN